MSGLAKKERVELTLAEWRAEAEPLFGNDVRLWRFVCPVCGGVQSLADFEALPAADRPKDPMNVFFYSCIGRYLPKAPEAFPTARSRRKADKPTPETHCNYTLGGLFTLSYRAVISEEGKKVPVFEFAPAAGLPSSDGERE